MYVCMYVCSGSKLGSGYHIHRVVVIGRQVCAYNENI